MSSSPRSAWWRWTIKTSTKRTTRRATLLTAATLPMLLLAGCRQDMQDMPKFYPQRGSAFYADGRSVRPQVANTVARSQQRLNSYFYTGFQNGKEGDGMPFAVNETVMARGQQQYNTFCTPCHSRVGNGAGMIVERGYAAAGNFHTARLEQAPLGHFFNVITNGYGAMPDYAAQLTEEDRWAVVAYIKALQLSQHATEADVPAGQRAQPLEQITEAEGLPRGFAYDWNLPPTAVKGTPNGEDFNISPETNNTPASRGETGAAGKTNTGQSNTQLSPASGNHPLPFNNAASPTGAQNYQNSLGGTRGGDPSRRRGNDTRTAIPDRSRWKTRMAATHEEHGHPLQRMHHGPRTLPASLAAPTVVGVWRTRLLLSAAVFALVSVVAFVWTHEGRNHLLRAYLAGYMTSFNLAGGALCMLMLQYVSGGKWGLILRRPLEAMSRTLPFVGLGLLPILLPPMSKHLYQWAQFPTQAAVNNALEHGWVTLEQALTLRDKRVMLSPGPVWFQSILIFAITLTLAYFLNRWSLERDADPAAGTEASFNRWQIRFENLSGIGIFLYVVCLTDGAIMWIKSLDITWYSSIWGLQFLVAQGYGVLAVGILTLILLSRTEPMKSLLRTTEQHDLGKLAFAFTMLNIYLCFAEFLIIWSGNVPDEIPWYLNRVRGGWWVICSLDFVCHWLIPFTLLLSRELKRSKSRMIWLASWMIFARCVDMFWLVEPNFPDAARNLHITGNIGILAYITVPAATLSFWGWMYLGQLQKRPLVNVNDPHLEEMLEPEHAH